MLLERSMEFEPELVDFMERMLGEDEKLEASKQLKKVNEQTPKVKVEAGKTRGSPRGIEGLEQARAKRVMEQREKYLQNKLY
mmetsp:Transcript_18105/g.30913  ORF Transcript_18105/g.30913 Transcript_18105/m.30913 type:complete len:82 (-) Transcript_18105:66-311(-)